MTDAANSGDQGSQPSNRKVPGKNGEPDKSTRHSEELAAQLAYECGWRACDDNLRTLEGQRTRSLALLSVTILTSGIVASVLPGSDLLDSIEFTGVIGGVAFVLGVLGVAVCTAWVAWPLETLASLRPSKITEHYVDLQELGKTPTWVYRHLARDLDVALQDLGSKLRKRTWFYIGSLVSTMIVLAGVVTLVLDVTF